MNRTNRLGRSRASIAAAIMFASAALAPIRAQPAPTPAAAASVTDATDRNAALQYWQAFAELPVPDDAQRKVISTWETAPLDVTADKLLQSAGDSLKQLHRGSACDRCDWGLNKQDSFAMRLPHLVKARDLARLACLRARQRLTTGQTAAAVEDIADTIVLARRTGADDILIGIMVQASIERMAINAVAPHLQTVSKDDLAHLSDRLTKLPPGGTLEGSIVWEREYGLMSLIARLQDPKSDGRRGEQWLADTLGLPPAAIKAAGATPQTVAARLNALRPIYDAFPEALKLPQPQAHARMLELQRQSDDNPLKIALPDFTRAYDHYAAMQTRLTLLRAAVAIELAGPQRLKDFTDPYSGQALEYKPRPTGFLILSKVTEEGQPVTLTIGSADK